MNKDNDYYSKKIYTECEVDNMLKNRERSIYEKTKDAIYYAVVNHNFINYSMLDIQDILKVIENTEVLP